MTGLARRALADVRATLHSGPSPYLEPHGLVLFLGGVLAPLGLFAVLADRIQTHHPFGWDGRVEHSLHRLEGLFHLHRFQGLYFHVGEEGVAVFVVVATVLLVRRRIWSTMFFAAVAGGVMLLNGALKDVFKRPPLIGTADLRGYVFPSGHAMGSFAVAAALLAIAWPTRWRRAALAAGATAVLVIGVSLPVFGVHYPTDVLAGWCVASAWTTALVLALPARVFD